VIQVEKKKRKASPAGLFGLYPEFLSSLALKSLHSLRKSNYEKLCYCYKLQYYECTKNANF
jgi:hypothetical protein